MTRLKKYLMFVLGGAVLIAIPALATGSISVANSLWLGVAAGLGAAMEADGIRFNWQSPRMFQCAGLYLTIGGKRYRIFKVGVV